jgi:type 1 glutamine amidotransferase
VLIFSRTAGFRHESIETGVAAIADLGRLHGFETVHTENAAVFDVANLENFDVVVWLNTTGDVLDDDQQEAFESFVRNGGGFVGIHSASDTEYDWPWFGDLLGGRAWFLGHPPVQSARLVCEDHDHPSTAHYPDAFEFTDEWYNFRNNPRGEVHVLLTLDEMSYSPGDGAMGADHPFAWYHQFDGGRAWYTGLGHRHETFADDSFRAHILGGIQWAAGGSSRTNPWIWVGIVIVLGLAIRGQAAESA